jgi:hypothetical protein
MKLFISVLLLFATNAFALNVFADGPTSYRLYMAFDYVASSATVHETGAVPVALVTVPLNDGYGQYFTSTKDDNGRTAYRTLVVSEAGTPDCELTATLMWDNGDSLTREISCFALSSQKTMALRVADTVNGVKYNANYVIGNPQ